MLAATLIAGCGTSVRVDQNPEPEPVLDDYELACTSMCDQVDDVCGSEPSCLPTCLNSRESLDPPCVEPAQAYWSCLGESLWSCVEVPHECTREIGELELCLSGCPRGDVGQLDEAGGCRCGGNAVGGVKNEVACELLETGVVSCDCSINGLSTFCEETVIENACSPVAGCCST